MKSASYYQFSVIDPGLFTTIQDWGRFGMQKFGVPVCGALDSFSARTANFLVGNGASEAVLEITLLGPSLYVLQDAVVAVTGAEMSVKLNGTYHPCWSAFRVRSGDRLELSEIKNGSGCRAYIAVSGGFDVDSVMGSRSCFVGGKFGGGFGRPLQAGDKLNRYAQVFPRNLVSLPGEMIPVRTRDITLRAIPGPQDDLFDSGLEQFFAGDFIVSPDANRIGYRLLGPRIAQKEGSPQSIISEPSLPGGVQIPPNGNPIILLVEQTVGGYSKIATVISCDLDRVAQASPGDRIRFEKVSLEKAYALKMEYENNIDIIRSFIYGQTYRDIDNAVKTDGLDETLRLYENLYPGC